MVMPMINSHEYKSQAMCDVWCVLSPPNAYSKLGIDVYTLILV